MQFFFQFYHSLAFWNLINKKRLVTLTPDGSCHIVRLAAKSPSDRTGDIPPGRATESESIRLLFLGRLIQIKYQTVQSCMLLRDHYVWSSHISQTPLKAGALLCLTHSHSVKSQAVAYLCFIYTGVICQDKLALQCVNLPFCAIVVRRVHLILYWSRLRLKSWLWEQAVKNIDQQTVRSWSLGDPSTRRNGVVPSKQVTLLHKSNNKVLLLLLLGTKVS